MDLFRSIVLTGGPLKDKDKATLQNVPAQSECTCRKITTMCAVLRVIVQDPMDFVASPEWSTQYSRQ